MRVAHMLQHVTEGGVKIKNQGNKALGGRLGSRTHYSTVGVLGVMGTHRRRKGASRHTRHRINKGRQRNKVITAWGNGRQKAGRGPWHNNTQQTQNQMGRKGKGKKRNVGNLW